eukprot:g11303.t1
MDVDPNIPLFLHAAKNPAINSVFCIQIQPSKMNHFTYFWVEFHLPLLCPALRPVNVPIQRTTALHAVHNSTNLRVIGKLTNRPFHFLIQVIYKDHKEQRSQN